MVVVLMEWQQGCKVCNWSKGALEFDCTTQRRCFRRCALHQAQDACRAHMSPTRYMVVSITYLGCTCGCC